MSAHDHATMLPKGALPLAAGMVAFALLAVAGARLTGMAPSADPVAMRQAERAAPVASRDLVFADMADGSVLIRDANGATAGTVPAGGESGFIRGVMRGLARDRMKRGIGRDAPFRLTSWADGQLSLTDLASGRAIELTAFGPTNRAAFAALLPTGSRR